ncbi:HAD family hydrolase [Sulfurospirillum sp. 1307]
MKTILFDLDGTLIDSTTAIVDSFKVVYQRFNENVPNEDDIKPLIGYPLDVMFDKLGISGKNVWDYVDAYKEHYRVISKDNTTLLPLAKEAIKEASSFARLGIVTTKTARYSQELLEYMGIMDYFETLIGREHVKFPKPHAEPILKAVDKLSADILSTWMIGDTILDLQSSKNANVNAIAVKCGYGEEKELRKYTNYVFESTYEAIKLIKNL